MWLLHNGGQHNLNTEACSKLGSVFMKCTRAIFKYLPYQDTFAYHYEEMTEALRYMNRNELVTHFEPSGLKGSVSVP